MPLLGAAGACLYPYQFGVTVASRFKRDVATAMKAGDRERAAALRLVLAELQKAAKDGDGDEQAVLRRERKRRRDAETAFRDAGRDELADQEAAEGELIDTYLPVAALRRRARRARARRDRRDRRRVACATWARAIKHAMAAAERPRRGRPRLRAA